VTELEGVLACMMTRDWQEGIDAFAAKRKPVFRGE
jgi:enoyl-CoA hydratase